ncbi:hypothetical protein ACFFQF_24800 [Haladaptatus pallidirubidus]|uniref:hypothetical protein n=1 Tax=Haladaptatus pallidirubidus TaxID=1008152 RepID=UPI0035E9C323
MKKRVFGQTTSQMGIWYRTDTKMQAFINDLLDDACTRDIFNSDGIRDLQREHLDERGDYIKPISALTTVELWLQKHLDTLRPSAGQSVPA